MEAVWLGALAVGPGLCLAHLIWARDRWREPVGNLALYLLLGALSVVPAIVLEGGAARIVPGGPAGFLLPVWILLGVALVEESCKNALLLVRARHDRNLEEPFDWLVYAVAVALGFATIENLFYVYSNGATNGFMRAFTAVPAHALNGTMMGWRLARAARTTGAEARRERFLALAEPTLWHAAYDLPLAAMTSEVFGSASGILLPLWLAVFFAQWRVCVNRIRALMAEQAVGAPPLLAVDALAQRLRARRLRRPVGPW